MVTPSMAQDLETLLTQQGVDWSLMIEDVQTIIDQQKPDSTRWSWKKGGEGEVADNSNTKPDNYSSYP